MAKVIDALLVTLGLDASVFTRGQKETTESLKKTREQMTKDTKEIEEKAKTTAAAFTKLKNEVITLATAFLGMRAMQAFAGHVTDSDAAVGRLSKNVMMSTVELSAWQGIAQRAGGSAEGMAGTIKGLSGQMQKLALTGNSEIIPFLFQAQVNIGKFLSQSTPMGEKLLMLADSFKGMDAARAQALGAGMGIDEGTVTLLIEGRTAVQEMLDRQKAMNVATAEDARLAIERQHAWQDVENTLEGVGRIILQDVTPAIVWVHKAFKTFLDFAREHMVLTEIAVGGLTIALGALSAMKFLGLVKGILGIAGAFSTASASGSTLMLLLGRLGRLGAAGVGGWAIGSLINDKFGDKIGAFVDKVTGLDDDVKAGRKHDPTARITKALSVVANPIGAAYEAIKDKFAPRGIRNNNPGNLNYVGQDGASKEGGANGRFAVFAKMTDGLSALAHQLQLYGKRGNDTISGIIGKFAPPGENDTQAYINSVAKKLGVSAGAHLDLKNQDTLRELMKAITDIEVGKNKVKPEDITSGIAQNAGARTAGKTAGGPVSNSSSQVHIGEVNVNTKATDANGIAKDIAPAIKNTSIATQANSGLS